jgi:hypothetical protein
MVHWHFLYVLTVTALQVRWVDIRVLELFSLLLCNSPKETSARGTAEVLRRLWLEQQFWGVPNEHELDVTALDPRVLSDAHADYMKFKLRLSDPSAHLLPRQELYPGPVKCPACRYTIQSLSCDCCFKLTQKASASKGESAAKSQSTATAAQTPSTATATPTAIPTEKDVTYFLDLDDVRTAVNTDQRAPTANHGCPNGFRAADATYGRKHVALSITAAGAVVCGHGVAAVLVDLITGERFVYADLMFKYIIDQCLQARVPLLGIFYDIACKYMPHMRSTFADELNQLQQLSNGRPLFGAVGRMHINMHSDGCRRDYSSMCTWKVSCKMCVLVYM